MRKSEKQTVAFPNRFPVPHRINQLREELFSTPDQICFARAEIATRSYRETEGEPWVLRRAKALRASTRSLLSKAS
jgi:pyruvate-formate lyase